MEICNLLGVQRALRFCYVGKDERIVNYNIIIILVPFFARNQGTAYIVLCYYATEYS